MFAFVCAKYLNTLSPEHWMWHISSHFYFTFPPLYIYIAVVRCAYKPIGVIFVVVVVLLGKRKQRSKKHFWTFSKCRKMAKIAYSWSTISPCSHIGNQKMLYIHWTVAFILSFFRLFILFFVIWNSLAHTFWECTTQQQQQHVYNWIYRLHTAEHERDKMAMEIKSQQHNDEAIRCVAFAVVNVENCSVLSVHWHCVSCCCYCGTDRPNSWIE